MGSRRLTRGRLPHRRNPRFRRASHAGDLPSRRDREEHDVAVAPGARHRARGEGAPLRRDRAPGAARRAARGRRIRLAGGLGPSEKGPDEDAAPRRMGATRAGCSSSATGAPSTRCTWSASRAARTSRRRSRFGRSSRSMVTSSWREAQRGCTGVRRGAHTPALVGVCGAGPRLRSRSAPARSSPSSRRMAHAD